MIAALSDSRGDLLIGVAVVILSCGVVFGGRRLFLKIGSVQAAIGENGKPLHDVVAEVRSDLGALRSEFSSAMKVNTSEHHATSARIDALERAVAKLQPPSEA